MSLTLHASLAPHTGDPVYAAHEETAACVNERVRCCSSSVFIHNPFYFIPSVDKCGAIRTRIRTRTIEGERKNRDDVNNNIIKSTTHISILTRSCVCVCVSM